jgi:hypothetical protein
MGMELFTTKMSLNLHNPLITDHLIMLVIVGLNTKEVLKMTINKAKEN